MNTPYAEVHGYGLYDVIAEHSRSRASLDAFIEGGGVWTYSEARERVDRLASVLRSRSIGVGDRLIWLGRNSFRVMELLLAASKLGAIVCPVNWRWSAEELRFAIDDFSPSLIFWQKNENRDATADMLESDNWICSSGLGDENQYESSLVGVAPDPDIFERDPGLPALAIYTAAYDGRPKAALLSQNALMLMAWQAILGQSITEDSGYLVSGPMFHIGVLMGSLGTLLAGGRNAFVPGADARVLLSNIDRHKLTHAFIAQPTIEKMRDLNKDGQFDVTSIFQDSAMSDYVMPLVMPRGAPAMRKLGGYGQTEMSGMTIAAWIGGTGAGRPGPFLRFKIADPTGMEVSDGEAGEILIRGPLAMSGYWNRPEENLRRVSDGWHRTNDLGKRLPDGSLHFIGPKTTMVKTGIENVYPAEVEACLLRHDAVAEACVIGVPDPTWDQLVKAVIVLKDGAAIQPEELINHCAAHIAGYKKPRLVEFVGSLPRNPDGTLSRPEADALFGGGGYPSS